jgi:hypothetical protein
LREHDARRRQPSDGEQDIWLRCRYGCDAFPRPDQELADAIRVIGQAASSEGFRYAVWHGWDSSTVSDFLDAHPPLE